MCHSCGAPSPQSRDQVWKVTGRPLRCFLFDIFRPHCLTKQTAFCESRCLLLVMTHASLLSVDWPAWPCRCRFVSGKKIAFHTEAAKQMKMQVLTQAKWSNLPWWFQCRCSVAEQKSCRQQNKSNKEMSTTKQKHKTNEVAVWDW